MQQIITLDKAALQQMMLSGTVIEGPPEQPRVTIAENTVVKFFYSRRGKKFYSSARRRPYALRFYNNSQKLQQLGIICPKVTAVYHAPTEQTYVVTYPLIAGKDFRAQCSAESLVQLAEYIAQLHAKGVYFRAIHLGNLLQTPDTGLALLDVCDVFFKKTSLNWYQRLRNLKHLLFYDANDTRLFNTVGIPYFFDQYLKHANLSRLGKYLLTWFLNQKITKDASNG